MDYPFSNLEKNTRYVVVIYDGGNASDVLWRNCFKTRGEFTNTEQGLNSDGTLPDLRTLRPGTTGCFRVARTRQDITDCMCNGTRGGTLILAGQTAKSQQLRQAWGCPNLTN